MLLALLAPRLNETNCLVSEFNSLSAISEKRSLVDDEARTERDHYERDRAGNGIDPWRIPGGEG